MGIRIHKAIGYALPLNKKTKSLINDFVLNHSIENEEFEHKVYFETFDFKSFFEKKLEESKKYNNFQYQLFLMRYQENIEYNLCKNPRFLYDVFHKVQTCDDATKGLLFIPSDHTYWFRHDDMIDFNFANQGEIKTIFKPLDGTLYPYPRYEAKKLEEDWEVYDWLPKEVIQNLKPEVQLRNFIPLLLKDLLIEMNIFKNPEDIHKLQPYKAIWWG